jgi:hypothetical protein
MNKFVTLTRKVMGTQFFIYKFSPYEQFSRYELAS